MRETVSVVVPVHNRLHLLRRALDTIFVQEGAGELFDLDVIVVDDASDAITEHDIRRVINTSPVRYVRHTVNRGLSGSRNTGISLARGAYVAFLDDDDEFLPGKLRAQVPILIDKPDVAMVCGPCIARTEDRPEEIWSGRPNGRFFHELLNFYCPQVATVLVRRSILEHHGGFDVSMLAWEDYDLWLRIAARATVVCVQHPVAVYYHAMGKLRRDLKDGTALRCLFKLADKIATYAPDEAGVARQALQMTWLINVRGVLPRAEALDVVRHALAAHPELGTTWLLNVRGALPAAQALDVVQQILGAYPELAGQHPQSEAASLLVRDAALVDAAPLDVTERVCASFPSSLLPVIWTDLSLSLLKRRKVGPAFGAAARALRSGPRESLRVAWHRCARGLASPRRHVLRTP